MFAVEREDSVSFAEPRFSSGNDAAGIVEEGGDNDYSSFGSLLTCSQGVARISTWCDIGTRIYSKIQHGDCLTRTTDLPNIPLQASLHPH